MDKRIFLKCKKAGNEVVSDYLHFIRKAISLIEKKTLLALIIIVFAGCEKEKEDFVEIDVPANSTVSFPSTGGEKNIGIKSNSQWTASVSSEAQSLFYVSPTSGEKNSTLKITASPNEEASMQRGIVTINNSGSKQQPHVINVEIEGAAPNLIVSVSSLGFASSGEQKEFTITANTDWTISSDASWISVSSKSGAKNSKINVTAAANTSTSERKGVITVSSGSLKQTTLLNDLLPLNIEARYPSDKEKLSKSLSEQYCGVLIERTEEFFSWIKKQL
jgi:hypothetical protein